MLSGVTLAKQGQRLNISAKGVFVLLGAALSTDGLKDCMTLDARGVVRMGADVGGAGQTGGVRRGRRVGGDFKGVGVLNQRVQDTATPRACHITKRALSSSGECARLR